MPPDDDANADPTRDAGDFSTWLRELRGALDGGPGTDVPCGGCTACGASSQFVHIEQDETETLRHIPRALLFPAPQRPGHLLMGYDEHGRCPMLTDAGCGIYEHRPRTCRTYDCRVFAATGIDPGPDKPAIAERVRSWRFTYDGPAAEVEQDALRASAAFLAEHPDTVPGGVPPAPVPHAVLAVEAVDAFLRDRPGAVPERVRPEVADVRVVLTTHRRHR